MADTTLPGLLGTGTHAARPAASGVGSGGLYSCTDHSLVYQSDGSAWTTWATLGSSSSGASYPLDSYLSASGSSRNDEFNAGPTIDAKWTLVGTTPDSVSDNSDYEGNLFIRRNDTGSQFTAYYQSLPSLPCIIVAKLSASSYTGNYCRGGGLLIMPSSPTTSSACVYLGVSYEDGWKVTAMKYTSLSAYNSSPASFTAVGPVRPGGLWLRMDIASATSMDFYASFDGYFWKTLTTAYNPGFTAATGGLAITPEGQASDLLAAFDFYRADA